MQQLETGTLAFLPLLVALAFLAIPIVIIAATPRHLRVGRKRYWTVATVLLVLGLILAKVEDSVATNGMAMLVLLVGLATMAIGLYFWRIVVGRLQEAAYSRWLALLLFIPFANLIAMIVFGILKPKPSGDVERLEDIFE